MSARLIRWQLELLLVFVVIEGLLRRLVPGVGAPILTFKFLFTCWLLAQISRGGSLQLAWRWLPLPMVLYLLYGTVLTFVFSFDETIARFVGIAVNVLFVPLAFLAASLYSRVEELHALLVRFTLLTAIVSLVGICQLALPRNHWMVVQTDGNEAIRLTADMIRVPGTFQFCNTYSAFLVVAAAVVAGAMAFSRRAHEFAICVFTLLLALGAATAAGSRQGTLGVLAVVGAAALPVLFQHKFGRKIVSLGVAAGAIAVLMLTWLAQTERFDQLTAAATARAFRMEDRPGQNVLLSRSAYYFESGLLRAFDIGNGIGVGWGVYTVGVSRFRESDVVRTLAEGGPATIMVETGVPGLLLIFAFVACMISNARHVPGFLKPLAFGLVMAFMATNVSGLMLQKSVVAIPWWIAWGACLGAATCFTGMVNCPTVNVGEWGQSFTSSYGEAQ